MDNKYILSDTIVFDNRPMAVPYNYRISYKIAQLVLIMSLCCSPRGGCSLEKLQLISAGLQLDSYMDKLVKLIDGNLFETIVLRSDPVINRALHYAVAEEIMEQENNGNLKLTDSGKQFAKTIMQDNDLMVYEKKALNLISKKLTEKLVKELAKTWRY